MRNSLMPVMRGSLSHMIDSQFNSLIDEFFNNSFPTTLIKQDSYPKEIQPILLPINLLFTLITGTL